MMELKGLEQRERPDRARAQDEDRRDRRGSGASRRTSPPIALEQPDERDLQSAVRLDPDPPPRRTTSLS